MKFWENLKSINVFVTFQNGVINLDIAAKVLINEPENSSDTKNSILQSRFKTKVRRLYDIANVLSAIGLIEKVDMYNCVIRKPIFKYTGPIVDYVDLDLGNQVIMIDIYVYYIPSYND